MNVTMVADTTTLDWATFGLLVATATFTMGLMISALFAASQARRSSDAAVNAAEIASKEFAAMVRPYVGIVGIDCQDPHWLNLYHWRVTLRNFGTVPAVGVCLMPIRLTEDWLKRDAPALQIEEYVGLGTLYPSQEKTHHLSLDEQAADMLRQSDTLLQLATAVKYQGLLGALEIEAWSKVYYIDLKNRRCSPIID